MEADPGTAEAASEAFSQAAVETKSEEAVAVDSLLPPSDEQEEVQVLESDVLSPNAVTRLHSTFSAKQASQEPRASRKVEHDSDRCLDNVFMHSKTAQDAGLESLPTTRSTRNLLLEVGGNATKIVGDGGKIVMTGVVTGVQGGTKLAVSGAKAVGQGAQAIGQAATRGFRPSIKLTSPPVDDNKESKESAEAAEAAAAEAAAKAEEKVEETLRKKLHTMDPWPIIVANALLKTFEEGFDQETNEPKHPDARKARHELRRLGVALRFLRDHGVGKFQRNFVPDYDPEDDGELDEDEVERNERKRKLQENRQSSVIATLLDVDFAKENVHTTGQAVTYEDAALQEGQGHEFERTGSKPVDSPVSASSSDKKTNNGSESSDKKISIDRETSIEERESSVSRIASPSRQQSNNSHLLGDEILAEGKKPHGSIKHENVARPSNIQQRNRGATGVVKGGEQARKKILLKKFTDQFPHYDKFISKEMEEKELEAIKTLIPKMLHYRMPFAMDVPQKFPIGVRISYLEKQSYRTLVLFLHYFATAEKIEGISQAEQELARGFRDELQSLRCIELRPASRRVKGYVNKIDNMLCIMLYRDREGKGDCPTPATITPFDPGYKEDEGQLKLLEKSEQILNLKSQLQKSELREKALNEEKREEDERQKTIKIQLVNLQAGEEEETEQDEEEVFDLSKNFGLYFGSLQFLLVQFAFIITWQAWNFSAWSLMTTQMKRVSEETRLAVQSSSQLQLDTLAGIAANLRAAHLAGDIDLGANWTEVSPNYQSLDAALVNVLELLGTGAIGEGAYIATQQGDFIGVFYTDSVSNSKCEGQAALANFSALSLEQCRARCDSEANCTVLSFKTDSCLLYPNCTAFSAWSTDAAVRADGASYTSYTPARLQIRAKAPGIPTLTCQEKGTTDSATFDNSTCLLTGDPFWNAFPSAQYAGKIAYTQFELTAGQKYRDPLTGTVRSATYRPEARDWYLASKANTKSYLTLSDPYAFTSGNAGLTITFKGLDPTGSVNLSDPNQTALFWAADVTLEGLSEKLRLIPLTEHGVAYLATEHSGVLVASSFPESVLITNATTNKARVKYCTESDSKTIVNSFRTIQGAFPSSGGPHAINMTQETYLYNKKRKDGISAGVLEASGFRLVAVGAFDQAMFATPIDYSHHVSVAIVVLASLLNIFLWYMAWKTWPKGAELQGEFTKKSDEEAAKAAEEAAKAAFAAGTNTEGTEPATQAADTAAATSTSTGTDGLMKRRSTAGLETAGTPRAWPKALHDNSSDLLSPLQDVAELESPSVELQSPSAELQAAPAQSTPERASAAAAAANDDEGLSPSKKKGRGSIFSLNGLSNLMGGGSSKPKSVNNMLADDEDYASDVEEMDFFESMEDSLLAQKLRLKDIRRKFGLVRNFFVFHSALISRISATLLVIFLFVIWLVWTSNVQNQVHEATDILINETIFRVRAEIFENMNASLRANMNASLRAVDILHQRAAAGGFASPWNASDVEEREIYLNAVFESFQRTAGYSNMIDKYSISLVYVGWSDGSMDSAGLCEVEGEGSRLDRCVGSKPPGDPASGSCYTMYKVQNGVQGQTRVPYDPNGPYFSQNPKCDLDPRQEAWYKHGVATGGASFGKIRAFADGGLGITASMPIYHANNQSLLLGVVACDVRLELVANFLARSVKLGGEAKSQAMLLQLPCGEVLATSLTDEPAAITRDGYTLIRNCTEIIQDDLRQTCVFLDNRGRDVDEEYVYCHELDGTQSFALIDQPLEKISRGISAPLTYASKIYAQQDGLEWGLVLIGENAVFFGEIEKARLLTLTVTVVCLLIVSFILLQGLSVYAKVLTKLQFELQGSDEGVQELESAGVTKEVLEDLMEKDLGAGHTFKQVVLRAAGKVYKQHNRLDYKAHAPVDQERATAFTEKRALEHVLDTIDGINVLSKCHLETLPTRLPEKLYDFLENDYYEYGIVQTTIIMHIMLMFWEPATLADLRREGASPAIIIIEFFCLCVEISNVVTLIMVKFYWRATNFLDFKAGFVKMSLLISTLALVTFDWFLTVAFNFSFEYFFPLRVFIFVFMNARVYKASEILVRTIIGGKEVYALYISFVLIAAVTGLALFRDFINTEDAVNNFTTFAVSLVTSFVYISTGENYNDLVYPAMAQSAVYLLWFFVFTVMGMFFVVGIVIEAFTDAFNGLQTEDLKHNYIFSRTGAVSAFALLDLDESYSLSGGEMAGFLTELGIHYKMQLKQSDLVKIFYKVDKDFDGVVTIFEFVHGVEEVMDLVAMNQLHTNATDNSWSAKFARTTHRAWFRNGLFLLQMINVGCFTLYGIFPSHKSEEMESALTVINTVLLFVSLFEQVIRIIASGGFEIFWNHARYNKLEVEAQWANRVELVTLIVAFVGWLTTFILMKSQSGDDEAGKWENLNLFFLAFPIVRLLTFNETVRHLMWCLVLIIPISWNLLLLLVMMLIWFAQVGVLLFKDSFDKLEWENNGTAPDGNFDNLVQALLTLFQVMGVGGSDVMYAAVEAEGWGTVWYFLLFTIVIQLLFMNLFLGVILSMFGLAKPMTNPTARTIQKQRLKEELFKHEEEE
eukprot:g67589.t1